MTLLTFAFLSGISLVTAYPWVANVPGVDSSLLYKHEAPVKRADACPFNADHNGAAPYSDEYPYTGGRNGLPGTGIGGIQVPAPGDTAHQFTPPGSGDIRGPCPGLNTAANHNFLSHDGITNFTELVDAQQNLYNVGWDLAVTLATLGVGLDGDIVSTKLSIGCDATSRTSPTGPLLGDELGLNGHNKFEGDTSLTRDDYFLGDGDDFSFNGTLFEDMRSTCNDLFDRDNLALYRYQRYQQSRATNPDFYFGPKSTLLFGAASFLYELFPSLGPAGTPDLPTIASFFGAESDGAGSWTHVPERIPDNWLNRVAPYTVPDVAGEIMAQYFEHPVLFGGNVGAGNFDALGDFSYIQDGMLPNATTAAEIACLLYQFGTEDVPSSLTGVLELPLEVVDWVATKLNPVFANFGCPLRET